MTIGTDIGDRVMDLRIERDLTQEVLAEMAGTSPTTISNLESGKIKNPQYRTMRRIAAALGVDVEELIAPKAQSRPSPEAPEAQADEERREELRMIRELLTDAHGLLEEMADEYRKAGATDKLRTLANLAKLSAIGEEQFVKEEVGPARDRASTRVYAAGIRLEEFIEDLLGTIQSTKTEPVGGKVTYLDALRRRRAS